MIKAIKPYTHLILSQKRWLILGFILYLIAGLAGIALLALSGWFISAAAFAGLSVTTAPLFNYLLPGASVRLFAYIRILTRYGERIVNHEATFRIIANLRIWVFKKLSLLSPMHLNLLKSSDLLSQFMADIGALEGLFLSVITPLLSCFCLIMIVSLFIALFNHTSAIITLIAIILTVALLAVYLLTSSKRNSKLEQLFLSKLKAHSTKIIQSAKEIIIFNAVDNILAKFMTLQNRLSDKQKKMAHAHGASQAILVLSLNLIIFILLLVCANATLQHRLSGANITLIILTLFALFESLQMLPSALLQLGKTEHAAKKINALIARSDNIKSTSQRKVTIENYDLTVSRLCFQYPMTQHKLINNLNLNITYGQHYVLTGISGSGKSSFINLFARFLTQDAGDIFIGHTSLFTLSDEQWQSIFCIVPQAPYLFDTTIAENLRIAKPEATDDELLYALKICQLATFTLGLPQKLETYIGQNGERLSGGQARRVALARAVLKNAPITILDEPTEGLDLKTELALIHNLKGHFKDKTLFIASHRPATIHSIPNKISF